jgi:hypothetical protein
VVDDGSTDQTAQQVARYADPRIRLFRQANGGESVARNRALDERRGEFVAFLDADDLWQPNHLALAIEHLHRYQAHDGVYTDGHYCDSHDATLDRLSAWRRGPFAGDIFAELALASDVFGPPICVVLRADAIDQRQLRFDPDIVIGPDWDFLTRFAEFARFGYVEESTCRYRVHQTNVTRRVDTPKRAASLARCREKCIRLAKFAACPIETQAAVFYDLLVNLLPGQWTKQDEVTTWPEFQRLPNAAKARLLRLMASQGMLQPDVGHATSATSRYQRDIITRWLAQACALNPYDVQARLLHTLYTVHPMLCKTTVQARRAWQQLPIGRPSDARPPASPFGKLV